MTTDTMREEFERWFDAPVPLERSGDGYKFMTAQAAWVTWKPAWQAAMSQRLTVDGEMARRAAEALAESLMDHNGPAVLAAFGDEGEMSAITHDGMKLDCLHAARACLTAALTKDENYVRE